MKQKIDAPLTLIRLKQNKNRTKRLSCARHGKVFVSKKPIKMVHGSYISFTVNLAPNLNINFILSIY